MLIFYAIARLTGYLKSHPATKREAQRQNVEQSAFTDSLMDKSKALYASKQKD
jgi:hypothetical protein